MGEFERSEEEGDKPIYNLSYSLSFPHEELSIYY